MEDISNYIVNSEGFIMYRPDRDINHPLYGKEYIVWGIGLNGFIHGTGSFLDKDKILEKTIIYFPSNDDIEKYYENLKNLFKDE